MTEQKPLSAIAFLQGVLAELASCSKADVTASSANGSPDGTLNNIASSPSAAQTDAAPPPSTATLGDIVDRLDERAFGLMLLLLALPCCLPFVYLLPQLVALPMLALAAQMAMGRDQPWLPGALSRREFQVDQFQGVVERSTRYVGWVEAIAHPSLIFMTGRIGLRVIGALLLVPCASILIPLPATNTTPGIGVAIAAMGLIEKDGRLVALGLGIGFIWIAFLMVFGLEAASLIKEWIAARL